MSAYNRRKFLQTASLAAVSATIVPRHVLGGPRNIPPSEKLNIAGIGVGRQGSGNIMSFAKSENIVALCDPDERSAAGAFAAFPQAKKYRDCRQMLDQHKDIDAVVVSTPDHLHAPISIRAMKMGKHVYCEKPMAHTVKEVREMAKTATQCQVATQMGNQGNAGEGVRLMCEWIWDGAIGPVHEVHAWTNKPTWPQGIDRPKEMPAVPAGLDWDLWLGPAPERPYHPCYLPFVWRGWWDFGSCSLGDMACHVLNNAIKPLKLGQPTCIEAYPVRGTAETGPLASLIYFDFPARENMPPVRITWYDGGLMPPRPRELEDSRRMGDNEGVLFVGEKGKLICGCYGDSPRLIPESAMRAYHRPPKTLPRSPGHHREWLIACKGGPPAGSNFEAARVLTEVVQLGNVALRVGQREENGHSVCLKWDPVAMKVSNMPEADKFLRKQYRNGWEI